MTARQALTAVLAAVTSAAFVLVLGLTWVGAQQEQTQQQRPTDTATTTDTIQADLDRLLAIHDCWTGDAPADMQGVIPAGVVVIRDGLAVHGGDRLVGQALDQIFGGAVHDLTVVGFCRR